MSDTLRIGIVACGPRAMQMAQIVDIIPKYFRLTAMSDPDESARNYAKERFPQITTYADSEEMLASGTLDAAIIETPPEQHLFYTLKAMENGLHVMGEIPSVNTYDEAVALWNAVKKYPNLLYMCGATANYRQKCLALDYLRKHDMFGKLVYAEAEYNHGMERPLDIKGVKWDNWRRNYDACRYCTHSIGPVLAFMEKGDEFETVSCMGTGQHFPTTWKDHAMVAIYHSKNNVVARILTAFGLYRVGPYHTTRMYTDQGMYELYNEKIKFFKPEFAEFCEKNETMELNFGRFPRRYWQDFPEDKVLMAGGGGHGGADFIMLEDFADAILNGKPSPCTLKEGLAMTLPGIFAADSAKAGGVLTKIRYPWNEEK